MTLCATQRSQAFSGLDAEISSVTGFFRHVLSSCLGDLMVASVFESAFASGSEISVVVSTVEESARELSGGQVSNDQ